MAPTSTQPPEPTQIFSHPPLPEAKHYKGLVFPLLCTPPPSSPDILHTDPAAAIDYLRTHRTHILTILRKHGVLLFRSFAPQQTTPDHFAAIVEQSLALSPFPYSGGNAVRRSIVRDVVFTANEAPPDKWIPFHHELAQTPKYPSKLLFYCDLPAETGGETPVVYSPAIYEGLRAKFPQVCERLHQLGVVYSRTMTKFDRPHSAIGRGWASTFGAGCRAEVENVLSQRGYSWKWRVCNDGGDGIVTASEALDVAGSGDGDADADADLKTDADAVLTEISPALPAVLPLCAGGSDGGEYEGEERMAFFNQVFAAWHGWRDELNDGAGAVRVADGSPIGDEFMRELRRLLDENEVAVPWQRGDFMLIDNMAAMHSRKSFTGKRVVLAALAI